MMEMYQSTGMIDMMAQQGVSKTQVAEIMEQSVQLMMRLMPSILIISRSVMAVITYFLTVQVLKRLKIRIPLHSKFPKWGCPSALSGDSLSYGHYGWLLTILTSAG